MTKALATPFFAAEHNLNRAEVTRLREEVLLLESLMDMLPDSSYFKDRESRFTRVNRAGAASFGLAEPCHAIGRTDFDYFTDEHAAQAYRDEQEIVRTGLPLVNVEEKETRPDGSVRWVSTTKMPLRDTAGKIVGTFGVSRDITQRKHFEEQLEQQAFFDPLTCLPNRALFMNRLQHLFQRSKRSEGGRLFAVLYLDVDRFKGINDGLGHQAGDELLKEVARRTVMPDVLIPVAEETGQITAIGDWMLAEACRQMRVRQDRYPRNPPLHISGNVSTRQLAHASVPDQVARILAETGLDATSLTLEITESALMQNLSTSAAVIQRLNAMAVRLHIDDFGTGYSSLSYLQNFPIHTLKVDKSFVTR